LPSQRRKGRKDHADDDNYGDEEEDFGDFGGMTQEAEDIQMATAMSFNTQA
jgi:hypothetical protein